jgi:hypothetical protein
MTVWTDVFVFLQLFHAGQFFICMCDEQSAMSCTQTVKGFEFGYLLNDPTGRGI